MELHVFVKIIFSALLNRQHSEHNLTRSVRCDPYICHTWYLLFNACNVGYILYWNFADLSDLRNLRYVIISNMFLKLCKFELSEMFHGRYSHLKVMKFYIFPFYDFKNIYGTLKHDF